MAKLKVFRYDKEKDKEPRYEVYVVEDHPGMTVLGALFQVQERHDESLAFRYSCRGAVCGICGVLINKVPELSCRTQIKELMEGKKKKKSSNLKPFGPLAEQTLWNPEEEILIEPLPNFPIMKDLVVDRTVFFQHYKSIEPWFVGEEPAPERERTMYPEDTKTVRRYVNCILCSLCHSACPVVWEDEKYVGPATLTKVWRFYADTRYTKKEEILKKVDYPQGAWDCVFHYNCNRVCPRKIPIPKGIRDIKNLLR